MPVFTAPRAAVRSVAPVRVRARFCLLLCLVVLLARCLAPRVCAGCFASVDRSAKDAGRALAAANGRVRSARNFQTRPACAPWRRKRPVGRHAVASRWKRGQSETFCDSMRRPGQSPLIRAREPRTITPAPCHMLFKRPVRVCVGCGALLRGGVRFAAVNHLDSSTPNECCRAEASNSFEAPIHIRSRPPLQRTVLLRFVCHLLLAGH